MFGYPLDMLLPCSAPLATVDHFNGGLLSACLGSYNKGDRRSKKKLKERSPSYSNIYVNNIRGTSHHILLDLFSYGKKAQLLMQQ